MSALLTSRQRTAAALACQPVDRVPCVPLIDNSYAASVLGVPVSECFIDPNRHAEALTACMERHPGADGFSINLCLADEIILSRQRTRDGWLINTTGGITWAVPFNDVGSVCEREILSFEDPRLDSEDPFRAGALETLRATPQAIREAYFVNAGVTGPFSQVVFLMGLERVLLATVDDPDGLRRAIEKRLPVALDWVDETMPYDPSAFWIGEGLASSSLIGPKIYRDFVLPYEKLVAERIHAWGKPCVLHICGKLAPAALELIPTSGIDCLEADWPVDLANARARMGKGIALKGNLNTTTLVQASPETIYRLSRELVESIGREPGFLLSSGCALGRDTPPANVEAMAKAVT
jgi:uroporphyrinogen decarboxylase